MLPLAAGHTMANWPGGQRSPTRRMADGHQSLSPPSCRTGVASITFASNGTSRPPTMCRITTRILPSPLSPVCACGGLPHPRSSRMLAACTRTAGGCSACRMIDASTRILSSVYDRHSDRMSAGIFLRGNGLRVGYPLLLAEPLRPRSGAGDDHATSLTQERTPAGRYAACLLATASAQSRTFYDAALVDPRYSRPDGRAPDRIERPVAAARRSGSPPQGRRGFPSAHKRIGSFRRTGSDRGRRAGFCDTTFFGRRI